MDYMHSYFQVSTRNLINSIQMWLYLHIDDHQREKRVNKKNCWRYAITVRETTVHPFNIHFIHLKILKDSILLKIHKIEEATY